MKQFPALQSMFLASKPGQEILRCIQCGTCSGSCPLTNEMDYGPRGLWALIRDGAMGEVLKSNTPWYCTSCYRCVEQCPQEIPVTDIMYSLKQMAWRYGTFPTDHKVPDLYKAFASNLKSFGRVSEHFVMAAYGMRHPGDAIKSMPLAVKMIAQKRIAEKPQATANRLTIKRLLNPQEVKE